MGSWLDKGEDWTRLNEDGWNIYVVLNPTKPDFCGIKPSDADIALHRFILLDADPIDPNKPIGNTYDIYTTLIAGLPPYPIRTYFGQFSGRGVQLWVRYEDTLDIDLGRAQARWLLQKMGVWANDGIAIQNARIDSSTSDASRLARMPMSINWKTGVRCLVLSPDNTHIPAPRPRSELGTIFPATFFFPAPTNLSNLSELAPRLTFTAMNFLMYGVEHDRHKNANAAAQSLRDAGVQEDLAIELVIAGALKCPQPLDPKDAIHCVRTAYRKS